MVPCKSNTAEVQFECTHHKFHLETQKLELYYMSLQLTLGVKWLKRKSLTGTYRWLHVHENALKIKIII